jgi:hypothetical protein
MYNVTLRQVRAAIFAAEKQLVLHILSVFVHPAVQHAMRMPHIARLCNQCPHYLINGTISEKKLLNIKCVF